MASQTHQEKDDLIKELKAKLKEMQKAEKQLEATAESLEFQALGVKKNEAGKYELVIVGYDADKGLAAISEVKELDTSYATAAFKAQQYLIEKIMQKAKGGRYV